MALAQSGLINLACGLILVFMCLSYIYKWATMIHQEHREDAKELAERLRQDQEKEQQRRSLPSFCEKCNDNTMVKMGEYQVEQYHTHRYECPYCRTSKTIYIDK